MSTFFEQFNIDKEQHRNKTVNVSPMKTTSAKTDFFSGFEIEKKNSSYGTKKGTSTVKGPITSGHKLAEFVVSQPKYDVLHDVANIKMPVPAEVQEYMSAIERNTQKTFDSEKLAEIEKQKSQYKNELNTFGSKSVEDMLRASDNNVELEPEISEDALAKIELEKSKYTNVLDTFGEKSMSDIISPKSEDEFINQNVPEELISALEIARKKANNKYYHFNGVTHNLEELREKGISIPGMERVQQEYEQAIKDVEYLGSIYDGFVGSVGLSEDIEKEYGSYISSNTLPLTEYKKQLQDTIDSGGDIGSEIAEAILGAKLLPENTGESLGFMFNMGSDKFNAAHMNQQEKDLYFSIMMKDGPEAADRFYKKIESRLKDRRTNEYNELVTEIAEDANGWERAALTGGEIATVTFSPLALGAKYLEVLRGETNGVSRLFDTPEIATNAIASDIAKDSKFKSWAYQLGISGGKALMSMGVSGGNGDGVKLLMGSDAATSAMNEAKNRGLTPAQTIAYGTTIGVIEGVTESIGLEAFFGDPTNILAYILKNAASEGTEEVVSELLGNLADVVINTDDAKYKIVYEQYKAKGMTDGEAYLQIAKELAGDVASSFAGGALLGGGFGGMGVGINAVQNVAEQHEADVETGNALLNGENAEDNINTLITEAKTSENKKLVKAAQKVENSKVDFGELGTRYDASARDTGKLMRLSEQQRQKNLIKAATLTDEQKNGYIKRLVSSGMSERDAKKAVKTLTEDAVSGEISAQTVQLVSSNNEARPIYEEISEYLSDEPMQKRITEVAEASPVTKITEELAKPNVESSQELADMLGITDESTIDDPVSILGKNKNGQLIIKTASGTETVYNEKAESLSGIARIKMNVASTYDISGANAYYTLAPDDIGSLKRFNTVFDEQYTRGNKGGEFVYINNGVSSEIQRAAYNAGKADLENAAARSRTYYVSSSENTAKIKAVDVNRGKVTVSKDAVDVISKLKDTKLRKQYNASIEVIKALSTVTGANFDIVSAQSDESGRYISPKGVYDPNTNTFTLDILSGMNNIGEVTYSAMVKTAGHELTHYIQRWDAEKYSILKKLTLDFIAKEHGRNWIDAQLEIIKESNSALGKNLSTEQAEDEIVADAFEDVLSKIDFAETVHKTDKRLFAKIQEWFDKLLERFKKALKTATEGVKAQSSVARVLNEAGDDAMHLFNSWSDAFASALENSAESVFNNADTTSISLSARNVYPYSMATVIQEYIDSVDYNLLEYAKACRSDINTEYKRLKISTVNSKQITDADKLLGIDFSGYQNSVERSAINHIEKRHGERGVADTSMSDLNDLSRVGYILENYDNVEVTVDADGNEKFSKQFRDKNNNPAPMLKYSKKINGTYYAIIACPDARYKKLWLVSAYIGQKNDSQVTQESDEKSPDSTPKAKLASPSTATNSISPTRENVNRQKEEKQFSTRDIYDVLDIETRADLAEHILKYIEDEGGYRAQLKQSISSGELNKIKMTAQAYKEAVKVYQDAYRDLHDAIASGNNEAITLAYSTLALRERALLDIEMSRELRDVIYGLGKNIGKSAKSRRKYTNRDFDINKEAWKGTGVTPGDAAQSLMSAFGIIGDGKTLTAMLNTFYGEISTKQQVTWEDIQRAARPSVEWIFKHIDFADSNITAEVDEILDRVKEYAVFLTETQISEIKYKFGNIAEFRKQARGKIKLSQKSNMLIEDLYRELSADYPATFDSNVKTDEIPEKLLGIVDGLLTERSKVISEYVAENKTSDAELRDEIFSTVYQSFWDVSSRWTSTEANKKSTETELRELVAALRRNFTEAERKARESARRAERASYRLEREILRQRRDEYAGRIGSIRTKLKTAIEKPTVRASLPKGGEELANHLFSALGTLNEMLRMKGTSRSNEELISVIANAARGKDASFVKSVLSESEALQKQLSSELRELKREYERIQNVETVDLAWNEELSKRLNEYIDENNDIHGAGDEMLLHIRNGINLMTAMSHRLMGANRAKVAGKWIDIIELRDNLKNDIEMSPKTAYKVLNNISYALTPKTMLHLAFGATENSDTLYSMYDDAQNRYMRYVVGAQDLFKSLDNETQKSKINQAEATMKTGLVDTDGNEVLLNPDTAISFVLACENEDYLRHIIWGGFRLPDFKTLYSTKSENAYSENRYTEHLTAELSIKDFLAEDVTDESIAAALDRIQRGDDLSPDDYVVWQAKRELDMNGTAAHEAEMKKKYREAAKRIKSQLDPLAIEWMNRIRSYYNGYAKERLDEATMERYGFKKTLSSANSYYPIRVVKSQTKSEQNELIKYNATLESLGSMKNRTKSRLGVDLFGAVSSLNSQIEQTATYYGWINSLDTIKKTIGSRIELDNGDVSTLAEISAKNHGNQKLKTYLDNLEKDISGTSKTQTEAERWFNMLHSAFVASALSFNISPAIKQTSAYPLVAAETGYWNMFKGLAKGDKASKRPWLSKAQQEFIARYSLVYKYRAGGLLNIDLATLKNSANPISKFMNKHPYATGVAWCEFTDAQTLGYQFFALKESVKKAHPDWNSEQINIEAGKLLDKTIQNYQANYTLLQRAPMLRGKEATRFLFGTFKSQQITMLNTIVDSVLKCRTLSAHIEAGHGDTAKLKVKLSSARKHAGKVFAATAVSYAVNAAMALAISILYRRKEWTDEELLKDAGWNILESYMSMLPVLGDVAYWIAEKVSGEGYWGDSFASVSAFETAEDALSAVGDIFSKMSEGELTFDRFLNDFGKMLAPLGIPARNAYNIFKALCGWIGEIFGIDMERLFGAEI